MQATENKKGYIESIGRRKSSVARVRITLGNSKNLEINGKDLASYFPVKELQETVQSPFKVLSDGKSFSTSVKVVGGGIASQAGAIRHGIARALTKFDETLRKELKGEGYLKRDPRRKERKKYGLKKARKAPQWSKR
jgi:small subunit ribosomal protein S9